MGLENWRYVNLAKQSLEKAFMESCLSGVTDPAPYVKCCVQVEGNAGVSQVEFRVYDNILTNDFCMIVIGWPVCVLINSSSLICPQS